MKTNNTIKVLFFSLTLIWGGEIFASSIGFTTGSADEDWDDNNSIFSATSDYEVSNYGFVVDTSVARNKLFNYRFSLMIEENESKSGSIKYKGLSMTHDFGFGVLRNKHVRLWVGPRLNVAVYDSITVNGLSRSGDAVGFAFGPVVGINIHLPKVASFSITTGRLSGAYAGDYDTNITGNFDIDFETDSSFINFSVLFRLRDEY